MREIKFRALSLGLSIHTGLREWIELFPGCDESRLYEEDTLGGYTGLKDKNGVEIYEGDIVGLVNKKNGLINRQTIIWDKEAAGFSWETTNSDSWPDSFSGFIDEYEVIGNICENPELLNNTEKGK